MGSKPRYDAFADHYESIVGDDLGDPVAATLLAMIPDITGNRILDVACGHGRVSRELARRGALVTGVDISAAMLGKAIATEEREARGIAYVHDDAASPKALAGEWFDGAICHFGLSDIDDLRGTLATVSRVLRRGGWFAFSIVHPCFPGWGTESPSSWPPGSGYYAEGWWLADNPGFRGKIGSSHRTLSTYLNQLIEHGLEIEQVTEPEPGADWLAEKSPGESVPVYLLIVCRRQVR